MKPLTVQVASRTHAHRHELSTYVAAAGCQVLGVCSTLQEALELQKAKKPLITVIDVSLSSHPGIGCVLALQEADPDCRIILAMAPMQLHFRSDAVHAGVAELLYVPFSARRVRHAILSAAA